MRRSCIIFIIAIGLLLFLGCAHPNIPASNSVTTTPSQEKPISHDLREQNPEYWQKVGTLLHKTLVGVSQVRQLSPPKQVQFRVVTADWAEERWGREYVKQNLRKIEINDRIWKSLFVLPQEFSLARLYAKWPRSYLMAKSEGKIYFVLENLGRLDGREMRKTMAHEVVHLLQGKHFKTVQRPTYDGDKAWSALVEGDADFTRTKYLEEIAQEPAPEIEPLPSALQTTPPSPQMPPAVARLFYFPYKYGEAFVSALYRKGGWQEVNQAYAHPPESTEQIIDPQKYFAGEGPSRIKPLPLNIPNWRRRRSDRLGEYFIRVMLRAKLTELKAAAAAQGWGGDSLTYYESPKSYLFTWQTLWDSNDDAAQFYEAFLKMLQGNDGRLESDDLWLAHGEYFWVKRRDHGILLIVSKDREMMKSALAAISSLARGEGN